MLHHIYPEEHRFNAINRELRAYFGKDKQLHSGHDGVQPVNERLLKGGLGRQSILQRDDRP